MRSNRVISRLSPSVVITAGFLLIAAVGIIDFETGTEISFSIFYLLPIALVTWYTNFTVGTVAAAVSALIWLTADLLQGAGAIHPVVPYWNALVRFLVFLAVVYLESVLKQFNQDLEKRVEERTARLEGEIMERKKVEARLEQYTERLRILHEIDQAILAADSLESVAAALITHAQNLPACDRVNFALFDFASRQATVFDVPEEGDFLPYVERHAEMDVLAGFNESLDRFRQQGIGSSSSLQESRLHPEIIEFFGLAGCNSLLSVPIIVQDELLGCLNLISCERNAFSAEYIQIGREIASQLGIAIKQAHMIEQLRIHQESLQALSQRLLDIQEAERRTIARELHDEVGQALTGLAFTLELAAQSTPAGAAQKLDQAYALVSELMERISQLSLELRPALLDDLGLLPTLLWYLNRYRLQTHINPVIKHSGLESRRFDPQVETAAFRILQEALTNVARHAHVEDVKITVWCDDDVLGVKVEDEGSGFDPKTALTSGNASGLVGMRERATLLNGKLTIESEPGMGTRVLAELPVSNLTFEKGSPS